MNYLTEKWQSHEESGIIWDMVVDWLEMKYKQSIKAIKDIESGKLGKVPDDAPEWNIIGDDSYRVPYGYMVPLDKILAGTKYKNLLNITGYKDSLKLFISFGPIWISSYNSYYNPENKLESRHYIILGLSTNDKDADERRRFIDKKYGAQVRASKILAMIGKDYPVNIDIRDVMFSELDIGNLKTSTIKQAFIHEFNHFMDKKKFLEKAGKKALIKQYDKERQAILKSDELNKNKSKNYFNLPTEVNSHSNEILRMVDSIGMLGQIKSISDLRKLSIHMFHNDSSSNRNRWMQVNQFGKYLTHKNQKKFLRRLRQFKLGNAVPAITKPVKVRKYIRDGKLVSSHTRRRPST